MNGVNLSSVPSYSFRDDVLEADRYRFLFKVEEARCSLGEIRGVYYSCPNCVFRKSEFFPNFELG